jgi:hypothetical protein
MSYIDSTGCHLHPTEDTKQERDREQKIEIGGTERQLESERERERL